MLKRASKVTLVAMLEKKEGACGGYFGNLPTLNRKTVSQVAA
jgi:hypothetical protein